MTVLNGPLFGGDADTAKFDALIWALRGLIPAADALGRESPGVVAADPEASRVSSPVIARARAAATRLPGIRDIWAAHHPQVLALRERLDAGVDRMPAPDPAIVAKLASWQGFAVDGPIVTIEGVPVPAGKRQIEYYMVQRYRPLYSPQALPHLVYCRHPAEIREEDRSALRVRKEDQPHLLHFLDYDARHVTDDAQKSLLMYSTAIHRDNLVALQRDHLPLFMALWRRDMATVRDLTRRTRQSSLPESNPASRVTRRARRLLYGSSLMNECERLFEVLSAIRADHGVTRQSVDMLLSTTAKTPLKAARAEKARDFVEGAAAHVRSLHPSMNAVARASTGNPFVDRVKDAFDGKNARAYTQWTKRIRWIEDEMPALYFLGVEAEMLAAVAIIQMIENMERHEGAFCMPGRNGRGVGDKARRRLVMELATIITANICVATARGILRRECNVGGGSDPGWLTTMPGTLIDNPRIRDEWEQAFEKMHGLTGDLPDADGDDIDRKRRSSPYERATARAAKCSPAVGEPGWTQGFRFDAWLRPNAELAFLRDCCRYTRYSQEHANKRDAWNAASATAPTVPGTSVTVVDIPTGLPRTHPFESIQDMFRPLFDQVQVAELVPERDTIPERAWREAAIRAVAPLLAAVSPVTLDPQLGERLLEERDDRLVRIATEGAWNT